MPSNIFIKKLDNTSFFHDSSLCGTGKSYTLYHKLSRDFAHIPTIIVVPRIDLIKEQLNPLKKQAFVIHSENESFDSVKEQINAAISHIQHNPNSGKNVLIITHQAFLKYPFWGKLPIDFELVIDEYLEFLHTFTIDVEILKTSEEFWSLFKSTMDTDTHHEVAFTNQIKKIDILTNSTHIRSLYEYSNTCRLLIPVEQWRSADNRRIDVIAILDPLVFSNFTSVAFLADGFINSPFARYLNRCYGIEIRALNQNLRKAKPVKDHVEIIQLADVNPSMKVYDKMTQSEYVRISTACNQLAASKPFIWSTNSRHQSKFSISGVTGIYLSPKQSGTNKYDRCHGAIWLAAMKTANHVVKAVRNCLSMTRDEIDEIRELEPAHQFILRTSLRDPTVGDKVTVIVFGPQQAKYLCCRYGISYNRVRQLHLIRRKQSIEFANKREESFYKNTTSRIRHGKLPKPAILDRFNEIAARTNRKTVEELLTENDAKIRR